MSSRCRFADPAIASFIAAATKSNGGRILDPRPQLVRMNTNRRFVQTQTEDVCSVVDLCIDASVAPPKGVSDGANLAPVVLTQSHQSLRSLRRYCLPVAWIVRRTV